MTKMLPRRLLVAALLAAGVASSAQAVNFVEIDGANLTFFYDADFWGLGTASVTGNKISFAISDDFDVTAKSSTVSGHGAAAHVDDNSLSVFAVAKSGYSVSSLVQASSSTSVNFTTGNGTAAGVLSGSVSGGAFNGDDFVAIHNDGSYYDDFQLYTGSSPYSTTAALAANGGVAGNFYAATGVETFIGVGTEQYGKGLSHAALTDVSYNFSVTAVPEPETYAMLLAGLGLVGFTARRRKQAA